METDGGIHHVTARGNRRGEIFGGAAEYGRFTERLVEVTGRHGWRCLSHCLMPNHIHLVVETVRPTLGAGMRDLLGHHAGAFNRDREISGHLFQDRYHARPVTSDAYFAQLLRYVALNPVKARLVDEPAAWPWSSHRALVAGRPDPLVATGRVPDLLEPWGGQRAQRYARLFLEHHEVAAVFGDDSPWDWRPTLDRLFAGRLVDDAIAVARRHGYRLAEIAEHLGVSESTVCRRARRVAVG